ncbi:hypothetical protein QMA03_01100 [Pseudoalteromonas sp. APC 3356]|uniref:hypothetical protein n=1 Tax=unclassified Pseudoalteromonas TaxID=194690 RepID=UPI00030DDD41|nr:MULTISPECIES: hypothetical protein [unclassified Pseudoalteromonas]MDN3433017.1 hypothetical protein [Pseudoalteromonas sp. APC 3356]PHQ93139.1 MAG: hypothetical protein COB48_09245 [Pseudoalteromonas sp.]
MSELSREEWIAIVGVVLAALIGLIQILRSKATKSGRFNVNQSSGAFSKGDQKIDVKVEQNDK